MDYFDFHHHQMGKNGIYNSSLNEQIPDSYFSIGMHPKDISKEWKPAFEKIKQQSLHQNCLAIGECGLDSLVETPSDWQEKVFMAHILWANEIKKPLIIHCVRRYYEVISFSKNAEVPMVIHGFNKNENTALDLLKKDFYLSFGKAVLHNLSLQKIIQKIPINKMFLETDNTDFDIETLYQKVADLKNISEDKLQEQILENLQKITVL